MKWKKDWVEGTTFCTQSVELTQHEIEVLQRVLTPKVDQLNKLRDKYQDIHESGEASTRQENTLQRIEDDLEIIENFINIL